MKLIRCRNNKGHYFDADIYASCPHCLDEASPGFGAAQTKTGGGNPVVSRMPVSEQPAQMTQSLQQTFPNQPEPPAPAAPADLPRNVPPAPPDLRPAAPPEEHPPAHPPQSVHGSLPLANAVSASVKYDLPGEAQKTVAFYDFGGDEPVVGWLVCVKGEHHGQSFQLKAGQNLIGRDLKMDVALTKDGSVSRNRHAVIMFDPKNARFYIQPGESGLTYLDGDIVLLPVQINKFAVMGIGGGEYLFVPLCGDGFSWDDYKD